MGGLVLAGVAVLMRRVLQMGSPRKPKVGHLWSLRDNLQAIYQPVAQEIETNTTILGITLNETVRTTSRPPSDGQHQSTALLMTTSTKAAAMTASLR